jgi:arylsulfatase A-like enzyme
MILLGLARRSAQFRLIGFVCVCLLRLTVMGAIKAAAAPSTVAPDVRPNILFLLSDDQRFDTIHALGNREIKTPNLDRLVRAGTSFTRAAIMGGGQGAICMPSRAMLMTGRTLFRATTTYTGNVMPADAVTWPQAFRTNGYDTFGIGKWHNDPASYARSFSGGGPIFFGGMSDHTAVAVHAYDPAGVYAPINARTATTFSTRLFADAAIRVIEERQAKQNPFVLYVAFTAPHDPRTPPQKFAELYRADRIRLPRNFQPEHPFDNGDLRVRDEQLLPWPRTPGAVKEEIASYYGMISHLDEQIGRILEALTRSRFASNTIIVFAGDNGLAVGQHGLLGKQSVYEHSVRVPLIVSGPGIRRNQRSDALCYLLDVMPTLCELAGVRRPLGVEGISLKEVLHHKSAPIRDELFFAYRADQRSIRDDRWKLIEYPRSQIRQLFDLRRDPSENTNLADDPRHRDRLLALQARLATWQRELGDPLVTNR